MDTVIIGNGEGELEIRNVAKIMEKSAELLQNWRAVSRALDIDDAKILELEKRINLGTYQMNDIPHQILSIWKALKGTKATLKALCEALIGCDLEGIAESLEMKFRIPGTQQLPKFILHDQEQTLDELVADKVSQENYGLIKGQLENLANSQWKSESMKILKDHISPLAIPKYYIPRTLLLYGDEVDKSILKMDDKSMTENLFLFKGITKSELATLTNYEKPIGQSGEELDQAVQFIVLEYDKDFENICRSTTKFVHFIEFVNGKFIWIKSSGMLQIIQPFLHQLLFSEEEMITKFVTQPSPHAFIVTDSPGMGKTLVLANWADKIKEEKNSNGIMLFIVLQEFLHNVDNSIDSPTSAIKFMAKYSSTNETTQSILQLLLLHGHSTPVYLFLDGYDEVMDNKLDIADTFLRNLKHLKNFKLFVSTRPHLKTRLEDIVGQHSAEILRFDESNQITFLTRYWITEYQANDNDNLKNFAKHCLKVLEQELTDKEKQVAGTPLQCRMIADIYANDAVRCSQMSPTSTITIKVTSLFDVYRKLVNLKFNQISEESMQKKYLEAHVFDAIAVIFPDWIEKFKPHLSPREDVDENQLYSIGLIERSHSNTSRFIHQTFAEYIVAGYLVESYEIIQVSAELLFTEILGCKGIITKKRGRRPNTYKFKYPVITYFLDMHLNLRSTSVEKIQIPSSVTYEDLSMALVTSCCEDLEHCLSFTVAALCSLKTGNWLTDCFPRRRKMPRKHLQTYFKNSLHLLVESSRKVSPVKKLVSFLRSQFGVKLSYFVYKNYFFPPLYSLMISNCSPLHISVYMGSYNIVTYLLHEYGQMSEEVMDMEYLLHCCVYQSGGNRMPIIEEKQSIIDLLAKLNPIWLEEHWLDCTPLLQPSAHYLLCMRLVDCGADINAYSQNNGTFLHTVSVSGGDNDCETFSNLLRWALMKGFNKINGTDCYHRIPLMNALMTLKDGMNEELLELFHEGGTNFNAEDNKGDSVLFYALRNLENVDIIKKVLDYGANINHTNLAGENAANIIMKICMAPEVALRTMKLLLSRGFTGINEADRNGNTPLLSYVTFSETLDHALLSLFQEEKANFNVKDNDGDSILFRAIQTNKDVQSIERLLDYGVNIHHKNKEDKSAVDVVVKHTKDRERAIDIINLLKSRGCTTG